MDYHLICGNMNETHDNIIAPITGLICYVVGQISFGDIIISLGMAFVGGVLGYLGKELGKEIIKRIKK